MEGYYPNYTEYTGGFTQKSSGTLPVILRDVFTKLYTTMTRLTILLVAVILLQSSNAFSQRVRVKTYARKSNTTTVTRHIRTSPDRSLKNNWSTKGNTNPYTGTRGMKDPYRIRRAK